MSASSASEPNSSSASGTGPVRRTVTPCAGSRPSDRAVARMASLAAVPGCRARVVHHRLNQDDLSRSRSLRLSPLRSACATRRRPAARPAAFSTVSANAVISGSMSASFICPYLIALQAVRERGEHAPEARIGRQRRQQRLRAREPFVVARTSASGSSNRPLRSKNGPPSRLLARLEKLRLRLQRIGEPSRRRHRPVRASLPSTTTMVRLSSCGNAAWNSRSRCRHSSLDEISSSVLAVMAKCCAAYSSAAADSSDGDEHDDQRMAGADCDDAADQRRPVDKKRLRGWEMIAWLAKRAARGQTVKPCLWRLSGNGQDQIAGFEWQVSERAS